MSVRSVNVVVLGILLAALCLSVAGTHASPRDGGVAPADLTTIESLPPGTYAGAAKPWVQVNDDAFGLDDPSNQTPPYQSEDGFEVTVFSGQLYVGMEADNLYGARVWRTKAGVTIARSQDDWEQVVDDAFGDVNNNDHIDSLEGFNGYLYASTAQGHTADGTEVWRSASGDAGSWNQVNTDGFGDFLNENFKDMVSFTASGTTWLCGGTMNWTRYAQVWCTTGGTALQQAQDVAWVQKNHNGFGEFGHGKVWSTGVMAGYLYVGTECNNWGACPGAVWRTDGTADPSDPGRWQWEKVFEATANNRMDIVGPFDGYMYVGFDGGNGTEVWRSDTGDVGTWVQVNSDGFGDPNNGRVIVAAATVYNGDLLFNGVLYMATLNQVTGAQVWRTADGTTWTRANTDGFGGANTFAAELISFNGYLYAWATNYQTGQKVLRTRVPICQRQDINGPGRYVFGGVGATIGFRAEELDSVEVCVYPGAFPEALMSDEPAKRHYEINPAPADGSFTADVTLSYTDAELAASGIANENTTYLVRWTGHEWVSCPLDSQSRDTVGNTATCAGVTSFSTWGIAGSGTAPTPTSTFTPTPTSTPTPTPTSTPTPTPASRVESAPGVHPLGGYGEPPSPMALLVPWIVLAAGMFVVTAMAVARRRR